MDINSLVQIISSVGFPIAACCFMAWFCYWQIKTRREDQKEQMNYQQEIYEKIVDSINNNTITIQNLATKLEEMEIK